MTEPDKNYNVQGYSLLAGGFILIGILQVLSGELLGYSSIIFGISFFFALICENFTLKKEMKKCILIPVLVGGILVFYDLLES